MTGAAIPAWPLDRESVLARAATVRARIASAGGDPAKITLVAVTKGFGPEVAIAAAAAGLLDLGENYAQELVAKAPLVAASGSAQRFATLTLLEFFAGGGQLIEAQPRHFLHVRAGHARTDAFERVPGRDGIVRELEMPVRDPIQCNRDLPRRGGRLFAQVTHRLLRAG